MAHEKIQNFGSSFKNRKRLSTSPSTIDYLDLIGASRHKVFSVLNSKSGRVLLRPFLLPNIDGDLSEIFELAENYQSHHNDSDVMDTYAEAFHIYGR